ncbi:unnamed protein product [Moneuplotes crassus]|uniref:Uncharacterized protein n=1 Tax=Euplotes crassus TaxID=5936 RepID=A0AAD2D3U0_EUPCR|nr:unnamed protein product [Moneuplotes crassus]
MENVSINLHTSATKDFKPRSQLPQMKSLRNTLDDEHTKTLQLKRQNSKKYLEAKKIRGRQILKPTRNIVLRKVFSEDAVKDNSGLKLPQTKRVGILETGEIQKESEEISKILRTSGGTSIIVPDLCHEISFDEMKSTYTKNPWKIFSEFIFKKNMNMSYLVNIRNCQREVLASLKKLSNLKTTILNNFEVYQSYIFQKFIKGKKYDDDKRMLAFLTLTHDKLYFKLLKQAIQSKEDLESLLGGNLQRIEKHAMFFNQEKYIMHERSLINCMKKIETDDALRNQLLNIQSRTLYIPNMTYFNTNSGKNKVGQTLREEDSDQQNPEKDETDLINVGSKRKLQMLKKILPKEIHQRLSVIAPSSKSSSQDKRSVSFLADINNTGKRISKFVPVIRAQTNSKIRGSVFSNSPVNTTGKMVKVLEEEGIEEGALSVISSEDQSADTKKDQESGKRNKDEKKATLKNIMIHKAKVANLLVTKIRKMKKNMPSMSPVKRIIPGDTSPGMPSVVSPKSSLICKTLKRCQRNRIFSHKKTHFTVSRVKNTSVKSPLPLRKVKSPLAQRNLKFSQSFRIKKTDNSNSTTRATLPKGKVKGNKGEQFRVCPSKFSSYKTKLRMDDL